MKSFLLLSLIFLAVPLSASESTPVSPVENVKEPRTSVDGMEYVSLEDDKDKRSGDTLLEKENNKCCCSVL